MTNQEIFDLVKRKLLEQNKRSMTATAPRVCRYRFGDLRCAVGHIIPDELYKEEFETLLVCELPGEFRNIFGFDPENDETMSLLESLQSVHDSEPVSEWKHYLSSVAYRYGLNDN